MAYPGPYFNKIPPKDPIAVLSYDFNWTDWLGENETITSAQVTVDPGLTLFSQPVINGGVVLFYLSGGAAGMAYNVACVIQTNLPDTDRRSFLLQVSTR